jgi:hypothetical protein
VKPRLPKLDQNILASHKANDGQFHRLKQFALPSLSPTERMSRGKDSANGKPNAIHTAASSNRSEDLQPPRDRHQPRDCPFKSDALVSGVRRMLAQTPTRSKTLCWSLQEQSLTEQPSQPLKRQPTDRSLNLRSDPGIIRRRRTRMTPSTSPCAAWTAKNCRNYRVLPPVDFAPTALEKIPAARRPAF